VSVKLLKKAIYTLYIVALMMFSVWYGTFMYPLIFGERIAPTMMSGTMDSLDKDELFTQLLEEQQESSETDLGFKVINQPFIEGRFHHIGFKVQEDKASVCVTCHGNVTHNESKELRSFLNMHAFFLACEACHAKPEEGKSAWTFRWSDKNTSEIVPNPAALLTMEEAYRTGEIEELFPIFGNYGAKIAPGSTETGQFKLLHGPEDMAFAERYIEEQGSLQDEQKSKVKRVIHKKISDEPVQCEHCHADDPGYLPFDTLGYPPSRMKELTDNAVVGMIRKYNEFYIPNFLSPNQDGKKN
jgi:hypothetical protein